MVAVTVCTLSGNFGDLAGDPIIGRDGKSTFRRAFVESNVPAGSGLTDVDGNEIRIGRRLLAVAADGSWSVPGLIRSNSPGTNIASGTLQYRVVVETSLTSAFTSSWFSLTTATATLGAVLEAQALPVEFISQATAAFTGIAQGYLTQTQAARDQAIAARDGAVAIVGPVDSVVAGLVKNTGGVGPLTSAALSTTIARLKVWAANPDNLLYGALTRDSNGAVTSAPAIWPDGTPGTYTADTLSTAFPGAVDAYHVTYGSPPTMTVTQPAVTRNSAGAVTARPALVVS